MSEEMKKKKKMTKEEKEQLKQLKKSAKPGKLAKRDAITGVLFISPWIRQTAYVPDPYIRYR